MQKLRKIMTALLCAVAVTVTASAQDIVYKGADASEVFRVRYNGDGTATLQVTTTTIVLVNDATTTTISVNGKSVATVQGEINGALDASSNKEFEAYPWASVSTDTFSTSLIAASAFTMVKGKWYYVAKWDTSAVLHYDVVPNVISGNSVIGGFVIDRIVGEPDGTGNLTVSLYEDDTLKWKKVISSPVYLTPSVIDGAGATTNTTWNTVSLDEAIGVRAKAGVKYLIRAARATTATTGGLGVIVKEQ